MKANKSFQKFINIKFNFYKMMLVKLPSIIWWGVKLESLSEEKAVVILKLNWRNQNPFKSVYFAALAGGAELSTGLLCMSETTNRGKWSMLVNKFEANFTKKATGKITFVCNDGLVLSTKLDHIMKSEDKIGVIVLKSVAFNEEGNEIGNFHLTWSFKFKGQIDPA